MKRSFKILFIVVCASILIIEGYTLGLTKDINISVNDPIGIFSAKTTAQQVPSSQTQPVVQTVPQTQSAPTEPSSTNNNQNSETETPQKGEETTAPSDNGTLSKEEIVEKVSTAVTSLKNGQNFKATKTEKTVINITQCSASGLTDMLNSICQKVAGEKTSTYEFSNGQAVGIGSDGKELNDGNPVSPKEAFPPKKEDFKLNASGVKEATAEKNGDSTTYTIKLISEDSTIDTAPQTNAEALGYLNLGGFNIPTVTITQADVAYPESVIVVTVDSQDRVTMFKYDQPMEGTMGMKITLISGSADFNGGNYETWEISY